MKKRTIIRLLFMLGFVSLYIYSILQQSFIYLLIFSMIAIPTIIVTRNWQ